MPHSPIPIHMTSPCSFDEDKKELSIHVGGGRPTPFIVNSDRGVGIMFSHEHGIFFWGADIRDFVAELKTIADSRPEKS